MVIALAAIAVPAVTANGEGGCSKDTVLGDAMFQTGDIKFPAGQDANFDQIDVGNDKAIAVGPAFGFFFVDPVATNNLVIEKAQKGADNCKSCCESEENGGPQGNSFGESPNGCSACQNACSLINLEQIHVGNRETIASGPGTVATNNVKISTVQK